MNRKVPLSVAISTMERPEALGRCLDALAAGAVLPGEIVIVDQSRDHRTRALVEARQGGALEITCVSQEPLGLGASQNEAVRRARFDLVAVTDDDCVVDPEWVLRVHRHLTSPDACDVITGRVLPLPPVGDRVHPVSSRTAMDYREFGRHDMPWDVGSGNNFSFRREVFLRIGGCDERLGPGSPAQGGVDMDLFYRMLRSGALVRYDPAVLVHHERDTLEGRRKRRPMYGRGMGACCGLRLREGDVGALILLARWVLLRLRLMAGSLIGGQLRGIREELAMLRGTVGGVAHGLRAPRVAARANARRSVSS
jgi:GT2 family glycosyltransferase